MKYCIYCGTKLIENARFCHQCGQEIPCINEQKESDNESDDIILKEKIIEVLDEGTCDTTLEEKELILPKVKRIEGNPVTLEIAGNKLVLSDEITGLKVVRDLFHEFANKNVEKFQDYSKNYISGFDDIYEKGIPISITYIKDAIENGVKIAKQFGISDMTYEWLNLLYEEIADYNSYFEYYEEIVGALEDMASNLASYRVSKRANVSYWQGGGFGIKGAIKGHIEATALNIGTNVVREIEYAVEDAKDQNTIKRGKERLYRNLEMYNHLLIILYNCSFMVYYALLPILEEAGLVSIETENVDISSQISQEAFEKYLDNPAEKEKACQELVQNIKNYPFDCSSYFYLQIMQKEIKDDVDMALKIMGIDYLYKTEYEVRKKQLGERLQEISSEKLYDIKKHFRVLNIVEDEGFVEKKESSTIRAKLRGKWARQIELLPEYDIEEVKKKVNEYEILINDYNHKDSTYQLEKDNKKDLARLQHKLRTKENAILLEQEDEKILTCLKSKRADFDVEKLWIIDMIAKGKFEELWEKIDKQNGYVQAIFAEYYIKIIMPELGDVGDIEKRCEFLARKKEEGNVFAKLIYESLVEKIQLRKLPKNSEYWKERDIRVHYLHRLNESVQEGNVYAKYCLALENIFFKYDERYVSYDKSLTTYDHITMRCYLKEAANSLIPGALFNLARIYESKDNQYATARANMWIVQSEENAKTLYAINRIMDLNEPLSFLKRNYEKVIEEFVVCSSCGKKIKLGKKFCSQCGKKLI